MNRWLVAVHSLTSCRPYGDPSPTVRSWDVARDLPAFDVREVRRDERRESVDFLRSLDEGQRATPTVNPGWSVHDVALHLFGIAAPGIAPARTTSLSAANGVPPRRHLQRPFA